MARICSAHKMLDYRNFEALADHLVWMPIHFLPGDGGLPAGAIPRARSCESSRGEREGSRKHEALGTLEQPADGYRYVPSFPRSDWKLFRDALQAHRLEIDNTILPEYGICVA